MSKFSQIIASEELEAALDKYWTEFPATEEEISRGWNQQVNFAAYLQALGFNPNSICRITGMTPSQFEHAVLREGFSDLSRSLLITAIEHSPMERFKEMVNMAIDRVEYVMMKGQKDSDILRAAELVLDRALGKVTQALEVKADSPLRKLLEEMGKRPDIEASGQSQPQSQNDAFVLSFEDIPAETKSV
jgi:hypothetical protein